MAKIVEEKIETKVSYNLTKRLYQYIKPYKTSLVIGIILVLAISAMELLKPMLIGSVIDDYIEKYDKIYGICDNSDLYFKGHYLTVTNIEDCDRFATIVLYQDEYYFFDDLDHNSSIMIHDSDINDFNYDDTLYYKQYSSIRLSSDDLKILRNDDIRGIRVIAVIYVIVLIANAFCNFLQTYVLQKMGQNIIYNIRQQLFDHVNSLPLRFFDTHPIGQVVTRITNDVEALNEMYSRILIRLFQSAVKIIGLVIVMLSIDLKMALYCFIMVPFIGLLTYIFKNISRRVSRVIRTRISILNTFLSENISGMRLIQIFTNEQRKYEEFKDKNTKLFKANLYRLLVNASFRPIIYFIAQIGLAIVLYNGAKDVIGGYLTIGTLYIFTNYISNLYEPIQDMAEQFSTLQNAYASSEKIFRLLDETNDIVEKTEPVILDNIEGNIEFKHVWFAYENDDYVLKDVSFTIEKGKKVAFVGATGAGKTSILSLIGRYYDIQKGQILVDGHDIKDLSIKQLRKAIGMVLQDVFVFNGTIYDNITLLDDISKEKVIESAKFTNADHFIEKLPNKYEEVMSERGSTLSMGQRQLLSFARTLAHDPKILVMDEATANIDSETELLIQDALEKMMTNKTTIMVAHRLSTIQHADKIIVMHKGRIVEMGNHQELLALNGMYKKLYDLQLYA